VLSQKTRYALKALLELSALPPGATLSSAAIAARRNIPAKFLEAILVELKTDGLVRGQRGRGGGYQLGQSPEVISFGAVVRLMEGPLALLPCVSQTQYRRCADCPTKNPASCGSCFAKCGTARRPFSTDARWPMRAAPQDPRTARADWTCAKDAKALTGAAHPASPAARTHGYNRSNATTRRCSLTRMLKVRQARRCP